MTLHSATPYKVYILRHVVVNAGHFQECFARSTAVPDVHRFDEGLHCMDVLNCARVHNDTVPAHAATLSIHTACPHEIPYPQLNRGSEHAEVQTVATAQAEEAGVKNEASNERVIVEENDTPSEDGSLDPTGRRACDSPPHPDCTFGDFEPNVKDTRITVAEVMELNNRREKYLRYCHQLKARYESGHIVIHVTTREQASHNTVCAEQDADTLRRLIKELWHAETVTLWAMNDDMPSLKEALRGPNKDKWVEALEKEFASLHELDTFDVVYRRKDQLVIKGNVVCKIKRDATGAIERFKCRYVACGYDQTEGVD
jgi:hypothetical protein